MTPPNGILFIWEALPGSPKKGGTVYSIAFCTKCRGMRVGWNSRYLLHCIICREWGARTLKLLVLAAVLSSLIFAFPVSTEVLSDLSVVPSGGQVAEASFMPIMPIDPAVHSIEALLSVHEHNSEQRSRIAQAVVQSGRKYNVDPKLVASIIIVESHAQPFAISDHNSIGIMQIHVPTWAETADHENINLLKIEDNIDFGVRILKKYIAEYGLWDGVMRYKGWNGTSDSAQNATDYVEKVKKIYQPDVPPAATSAN
jgi:hypothetical protein